MNWPDGPARALRRLARAFEGWRRRRAGRPRQARLYPFAALSDRSLADIGLRRADVCAAMIGIVPLGGVAPVRAPHAAVCQMPGVSLTLVASDLSDAA